MTGFFVVLAIPFGRLSDRIDRRYVLYAAFLVLGAACIGLPYCRNGTHLLLIFPGIGVSMALFWPAYEAWLAEREGEGELVIGSCFSTVLEYGYYFRSSVLQLSVCDANPFRPFYLASISTLFTLVTIFGVTS